MTSRVYRLNIDCGRNGEIDSLFVARKIDVDAAGRHGLHFSEVLGKYSEIFIEPIDVFFEDMGIEEGSPVFEFVETYPIGPGPDAIEHILDNMRDDPSEYMEYGEDRKLLKDLLDEKEWQEVYNEWKMSSESSESESEGDVSKRKRI